MKQESNRQRTMEDIDRGLHPAVDGQSLGEDEEEEEGGPTAGDTMTAPCTPSSCPIRD